MTGRESGMISGRGWAACCATMCAVGVAMVGQEADVSGAAG